MFYRGLGKTPDSPGKLSLHFAGTANANMLLMKKTILVVDDDASVRESVNKVLRDAGFEAVLAAGGLEAIVRFDSGSIALVLLDIGLPNQNGWETCRHLTREHSDVPVIVMTGQTGQFNSALAAGAAALMEKPLDAHELLHTIRVLLDRAKESGPCRSIGTFYYTAS
jgi:DNA-binding response OmpR family regulator